MTNDNDKLNDIEKFKYLQSLKGVALNSIKHLID